MRYVLGFVAILMLLFVLVQLVVPGSQLVVYPDAGHGGVFQFHEDFVKRALEFL